MKFLLFLISTPIAVLGMLLEFVGQSLQLLSRYIRYGRKEGGRVYTETVIKSYEYTLLKATGHKETR